MRVFGIGIAAALISAVGVTPAWSNGPMGGSGGSSSGGSWGGPSHGGGGFPAGALPGLIGPLIQGSGALPGPSYPPTTNSVPPSDPSSYSPPPGGYPPAGYDPSATVAPVPAPMGPPGPNWGQIDQAMGDASRNLGFSTTFVARGFVGLIPGTDQYWSCVGAATDRANAVADALQRVADNGGMANYTATVGTRNGYQIMGASFHTYTVVQIKDPGGNVIKNYEIDNYVGPTSVKPANPTPNFDPYHGDSDVVRGVQAAPGGR